MHKVVGFNVVDKFKVFFRDTDCLVWLLFICLFLSDYGYDLLILFFDRLQVAFLYNNLIYAINLRLRLTNNLLNSFLFGNVGFIEQLNQRSQV